MKPCQKKSFISGREASNISSQRGLLALHRSHRWTADAFLWALVQDLATCMDFPSELASGFPL